MSGAVFGSAMMAEIASYSPRWEPASAFANLDGA